MISIKNIFTISLLTLATIVLAQTKSLQISQNIMLPKDTVKAKQLIKSLNGFLSLKDGENKKNSYVLKEDLVETSMLLDEMKGIEKSKKYKDDNFYKGYLTNVLEFDNDNFLIQFSYIGINEKTPLLIADFEILAKRKNNDFYFLSPLKRNTFFWQTKKIKNATFHFKNNLNIKIANEYVKSVSLFDKKLKSKNSLIEWYGCDDLPELLQLIGVKYKFEHNGKNYNIFSSNENDTFLLITGEINPNLDSFDLHDLWHERLRNIHAKSDINKAIDEGCAYLYGGSWGISWDEILKKFKEKVAINSTTNWLDQIQNNVEQINFGDSREKNLRVEYVLNALLVQKIEKDRGFDAVIEFLCCGKNTKEGNENYFIVLEKLTGITKNNFNDNIWALIKKSK